MSTQATTSNHNNSFAEALVNGIIANVICANSSKTTYKDIVSSLIKVLILYSIQDIKDCMKSFFTKIQQILPFLLIRYNRLRNLKQSQEISTPKAYEYTIDIKGNFIECLCKFLQNAKGCSYEKHFVNLCIEDMKNVSRIYELTNIRLNPQVRILESLTLSSNGKTFNLYNRPKIPKKIQCPYDLIPPVVREEIKDCKCTDSGGAFDASGYFEFHLYRKFKSYYNFKNDQESFEQLMVLLSIYTATNISTVPSYLSVSNFITNSRFCLDPNSKNFYDIHCNSCYAYPRSTANQKISYFQKMGVFSSITFSVDSSIEEPEDILQNTVDEILTMKSIDFEKVKVYNCKLNKKIVKNQNINPEYVEWENRIKENKDFAQVLAPQKFLITEELEKNIEIIQINEQCKSLDRLYLKKSDKDKLLINMDQFKNNKELLEELGFQHKLNILLYGKCGTGKSTTIIAVASYLEKDVYYVDLRQIETNEELQMLIEHVNKNVSGGGMIVMEDIDAMTNVVLKRSEEVQEFTINEVFNQRESGLSLEYLLNILQGTLTIDDSVFIVTTNHFQKLDSAFYRDGRFDIVLELGCCDHFQISEIYKGMMNREIDAEVLKRIPEYKYTPAQIIYHLKLYLFNNDKSDLEIFEKFV